MDMDEYLVPIPLTFSSASTFFSQNLPGWLRRFDGLVLVSQQWHDDYKLFRTVFVYQLTGLEHYQNHKYVCSPGAEEQAPSKAVHLQSFVNVCQAA